MVTKLTQHRDTASFINQEAQESQETNEQAMQARKVRELGDIAEKAFVEAPQFRYIEEYAKYPYNAKRTNTVPNH